jgi:glutamine synthetase adenylyltransferase
MPEVRRTLESKLASVEHRASETNGVAPEHSLSQHERQGAARLAWSGCGEVGGRELGYMSCVMTRGNMRELAGI